MVILFSWTWNKRITSTVTILIIHVNKHANLGTLVTKHEKRCINHFSVIIFNVITPTWNIIPLQYDNLWGRWLYKILNRLFFKDTVECIICPADGTEKTGHWLMCLQYCHDKREAERTRIKYWVTPIGAVKLLQEVIVSSIILLFFLPSWLQNLKDNLSLESFMSKILWTL